MVRTNSTNPDFITLVKKLDAYPAVIEGKEHSFYAQYNKNSWVELCKIE